MDGIAQVRDAHTGDDCRIPEDGRRVREVVEEPHSCARATPTGGDATLGLVDFAMFPHLDHEDLPDNSMASRVDTPRCPTTMGRTERCANQPLIVARPFAIM